MSGPALASALDWPMFRDAARGLLAAGVPPAAALALAAQFALAERQRLQPRFHGRADAAPATDELLHSPAQCP